MSPPAEAALQTAAETEVPQCSCKAAQKHHNCTWPDVDDAWVAGAYTPTLTVSHCSRKAQTGSCKHSRCRGRHRQLLLPLPATESAALPHSALLSYTCCSPASAVLLKQDCCCRQAHLMLVSCERCQWFSTDILLSSNGHALSEGACPAGQNRPSCAMTLCTQTAASSNVNKHKEAATVTVNIVRSHKVMV